MGERIEKGDKVTVNFHGSQITLVHRGLVLYVPCSMNDRWIIKDTGSGEIHHISEGCTVTKNKPEDL